MSMKDSKDQRLEPIGEALARAGIELADVVAMINDLEDVVGHAISVANSTRELQVAELQQIDRVRQKIEGAAEFITSLTRLLPRDWLVDAAHAARSVAMTDLAHRLAGHPDPHKPTPHPAGEIYELF